MLTFYKKYWRTAFDIGLIVLTVYLFMLAFSYLYKIATPVFLSFLIFMIIEPLARRFNKWGIKKSIASALSILVFSFIIIAAFVAAGFVITNEVTALIEKLPVYQEILKEQVAQYSSELENRVMSLPPEVTALLDKSNELIDYLTKRGTVLATSFLSWLVGFLTSFSTFIINFAIGIVLAYFLSIEIGDWKKVASDKTPRTFKLAFQFLRENVFKGIAGYIKAQLKLVTITFIIILAALLILRVENAFSISAIAAIFDLLPLLGVSTIFIPWIIYLFIVGKTSLAISLTVLLLAIILARQILEPKITGDSLGVSAFTTMVFMIVSLSLFGIAGLIISPILVILIKALYDQGYLQRWIRHPQDEFDLPEPLKPR